MIDVSRRNSAAAEYLDSLETPVISVITAHELIVGAHDKRDQAAIEIMVNFFPVVHIDAAIGDFAYGLLKRYAKSHGLRPLDALIAATALDIGACLVTRNRKHFTMIEDLVWEIPDYKTT
jgi:predicted nucleic acid-binding protein